MAGEIRKTKEKLAKGAILGLAAGDALGVPVEFTEREELKEDPVCGMRGYGTYCQEPGTWSDDTSMALCVMDSLAKKGVDYEDQMTRFVSWVWEAKYTAGDEMFDIGNTTRRAIFKAAEGKPFTECGERGEFSCGNGSIMRMAPMSLYVSVMASDGRLTDESYDMIHKASMDTHAHPRCLMACGIYTSVVNELIRSDDLKSAVMTGIEKGLSHYEKDENFRDEMDTFEFLRGIADRSEDEIRGNGYVVNTLAASVWCLLNSKSYEECVLKAVNLGEDTDTTGATAGGLAGIWYGDDGIPKEWIEVLRKSDYIKEIAERFAENI